MEHARPTRSSWQTFTRKFLVSLPHRTWAGLHFLRVAQVLRLNDYALDLGSVALVVTCTCKNWVASEMMRFLIVVGTLYFVGRYQMDEAPAEITDHFYAIGRGGGSILRYPLELFGLIS